MRKSSDWDNISLSCQLNRLNKHSRWDKWQDKVSFCSLICFNWRVPSRVPLFSLGLKAHRSGPCGHSGRLSEVVLTHYRRCEVRNSIYRYREIHIDYRSKFSYRFVSFISIIYGNTNENALEMAAFLSRDNEQWTCLYVPYQWLMPPCSWNRSRSTDERTNKKLVYDPSEHEHGLLPQPLHVGKYLRLKRVDFQLPYDIWWMYKHNAVSSRKIRQRFLVKGLEIVEKLHGGWEILPISQFECDENFILLSSKF